MWNVEFRRARLAQRKAILETMHRALKIVYCGYILWCRLLRKNPIQLQKRQLSQRKCCAECAEGGPCVHLPPNGGRTCRVLERLPLARDWHCIQARPHGKCPFP